MKITVRRAVGAATALGVGAVFAIASSNLAMAEQRVSSGARSCVSGSSSPHVAVESNVRSYVGDEAQLFATYGGSTHYWAAGGNTTFKVVDHTFSTSSASDTGAMADVVQAGSTYSYCWY